MCARTGTRYWLPGKYMQCWHCTNSVPVLYILHGTNEVRTIWYNSFLHESDILQCLFMTESVGTLKNVPTLLKAQTLKDHILMEMSLKKTLVWHIRSTY